VNKNQAANNSSILAKSVELNVKHSQHNNSPWRPGSFSALNPTRHRGSPARLVHCVTLVRWCRFSSRITASSSGVKSERNFVRAPAGDAAAAAGEGDGDGPATGAGAASDMTSSCVSSCASSELLIFPRLSPSSESDGSCSAPTGPDRETGCAAAAPALAAACPAAAAAGLSELVAGQEG
jgi:hypothetical protein